MAVILFSLHFKMRGGDDEKRSMGFSTLPGGDRSGLYGECDQFAADAIEREPCHGDRGIQIEDKVMPEKDKPSNKDHQQGMSETAKSPSAGSAGQEGKSSGSQQDTGRATQDKPETSGGE